MTRSGRTRWLQSLSEPPAAAYLVVKGINRVHDCSVLQASPVAPGSSLTAMFIEGRVGTTCPLSRQLTRVSLASVAYRSAGTAKHDGIQRGRVDFCPLGGVCCLGYGAQVRLFPPSALALSYCYTDYILYVILYMRLSEPVAESPGDIQARMHVDADC